MADLLALAVTVAAPDPEIMDPPFLVAAEEEEEMAVEVAVDDGHPSRRCA